MDGTVLLLERPSARERTLPVSTTRLPPRAADRLALTAVYLIAVALAGVHYAQFLQVHRSLWDGPLHDRNAHYLFALRLATDVRQMRFGRLLIDLNSARVWPPLHGVLALVPLLIGGLDYRLAVLPSVVGFAGTVVVGFLVARRAAPRGGNFAGLVAALFIAASPAYRAYATDIMLESSGACLSLAAVYCYLVAVQGPSARAGRWLGLVLTALFLLKYNYWLLVVLALSGSIGMTRGRRLVNFARRTMMSLDWRGATKAELRRPLSYLVVALLLLIAAIWCHGDAPLRLAGRTVSLYPPHNVVQFAYVVVFLRLARWWYVAGRDRVARVSPCAGQVVRWHALPVAVWFLLPRHLGCFIWFLSPANAEAHTSTDLVGGLVAYFGWLWKDYHIGPASAAAGAALAASAVVTCRRLRPGGSAVLWLVLVGALLAASHPNRKARFLHSWLDAGWVAAGVGLVTLTHGRLTARRTPLRPWLAGVALGALALTHCPAVLCRGRAAEGGPHPARSSWLELTDIWRDELAASRKVAVLSSFNVGPLVEWTYLESRGSLDGLEDTRFGFGARGEENRRGFLAWLQATDCDALLVIESLPGAAGRGFERQPLHCELLDLLRDQSVFRPVARRELPRHGMAVTIWGR